MGFRHPEFLIALLAMLVPIILHLLNRRHAKLLEWGATQFLLGSLVSRRRRLLIEEMMLLAMRCLLCALVALAIARPLIQQSHSFLANVKWASVLPLLLLGTVALAVGTAFWQERIWRWRLWAAGALMILGALLLIVDKHKDNVASRVGVERDVAIVIDTSTTMALSADGKDGKSNFQRAVEEAKLLVSKLDPGTTVTVVLAGSAPKVVTEQPLTQRTEIDRVLSDLKAPAGGASAIRPAIQAAWLRLQSAPHTAKQIVIFTDRQRNSWQVDDQVRWQESLTDLKTDVAPPQIYARAFPLPQTLRNVTVTRVEPGRQVVGTDRAVSIDVQIANTGTEPMSAATVDLLVDGKKVTDKYYSKIEPGGVATINFFHRFDKPGARIIEARTSADDELKEDNSRQAAVRVMDRLPVLIVNSGPEPEFLQQSSAYAQLALAPGAGDSPGGDGAGFPPLVQTVVVDPLHLSAQRNLSDYRVIILADVPKLADAEARRLAEFVSKGGSLLIAPGARALPDFYNKWQQADGKGPLLPAKLKQRHEVTGDEKPLHLALSTFEYPALRPWIDPKITDLESALFRGYWKLADADGGKLRSGGNFTNGDPLLVEKQVGTGNVVLLSASLDTAASNFATRKAFPVLMHSLVYHLAELGRSGLTFESGQEPTLTLVGESGHSVAFRYWKPGLRGEYFANADFNQPPAAKRVDSKLEFDWQAAAPLPQVQPAKFGVRWSGAVVAPKSETVKLILTGQGSGQLWWDDKPLITRPNAGAAEASVTVQAGNRYRLRVEETKTTGAAGAKLEWESPTTGRQVIPETALAHDEEAAKSDRKEDAYELTLPDGTKRPVTGEARDGVLSIKLPAVHAPGICYLKPPDSLINELSTTQDDNQRIPVVMTTARQEADMTPIENSDWAALHTLASIEHPEDATAIDDIALGKPWGQELWKYLAITALILLIAEIALTRWIAIQRQVTVDPVGDFEYRARTGDAAYLHRFTSPGGARPKKEAIPV